MSVAVYCYEYGQTWWPHWGPRSVEEGGAGGSEEAVILLTQELAKLGMYDSGVHSRLYLTTDPCHMPQARGGVHGCRSERRWRGPKWGGLVPVSSLRCEQACRCIYCMALQHIGCTRRRQRRILCVAARTCLPAGPNIAPVLIHQTAYDTCLSHRIEWICQSCLCGRCPAW